MKHDESLTIQSSSGALAITIILKRDGHMAPRFLATHIIRAFVDVNCNGIHEVFQSIRVLAGIAPMVQHDMILNHACD